jgi:hypothetical protein
VSGVGAPLRQGRCGWRRRGSAVGLALALIALTQLGTNATLAAEGPLAAAGFTAGPLITDAGLVWEGSAGVLLTRTNGTTSVLANRGVPNWDNFIDQAWFGSRWWVIAGAGGVLGGHIGGRLKPLRALARCDPGSKIVAVDSAGGTSSLVLAISGKDLLAALPRSCAPRNHLAPETLVRIDLRTGASRVIARLHAVADSIAAAARYVALAFTRSTPPGAGREAEPHEVVRVLDARTGALVRQIMPPAQDGRSAAIQIDAAGDVLGGCCETAARELAQVAQRARIETYWWAPAGAKAGRQIQLGEDAVLSDRRIAYRGLGASGGPVIDVRDMRDGQTRTAVTFTGAARPASLAVSENELAWEQQSFGLLTPPGACLSTELTPPQLMSIDLRTLAAGAFVVVGPEPPALQHECVSLVPLR